MPASQTLTGATTGLATEATLATRASEATLATRASEATLATRASEATLATRASEATLAQVRRPSQGTGRTNVTGNLAVQNADANVYSVTAGKTLYVTSLTITAFNTSGAAVGDLRVRDGNGGAVKLPFIMATAGVGAVIAIVPLQLDRKSVV